MNERSRVFQITAAWLNGLSGTGFVWTLQMVDSINFIASRIFTLSLFLAAGFSLWQVITAGTLADRALPALLFGLGILGIPALLAGFAQRWVKKVTALACSRKWNLIVAQRFAVGIAPRRMLG